MSTDISPGQFVDSPDSTKIWAHACGNPSKPAVVFIGFACTADAFDKQYTNAEMLESLYIIRYDLRGCGRSDGPLNIEAYSSERQAEDFKAVIDTFNVKKPFVAAWSLGGIVPADVLTKYGTDSLAGLILMSSFPHRNMLDVVIHPFISSLIPGLVGEDSALWAITLPKFVLSCVAPSSKLPYDVQAKWMGGAAPRAPAVRQHMLGRSQDEAVLMSIADRIPVMAIQGEVDQHLIPQNLENYIKNHFSRSEFHLLLGVGHAPFFEAPDVTNRLILEFVRKHV